MNPAQDKTFHAPVRLRGPAPNSFAAIAAIAATTLSAAATSVHAEQSPFFVEAALSRAVVDIADERFNPSLLRVQGGWYFWPGIAIAVQLGAGLRDDSALGFDAEVESLASWFLRFESPEIGGFSVSLQGGYSEARLSLENRNGTSPGAETFTSPTLGVAIAQRIGHSPWSLNADYYQHYEKDGVDLRTLSIGLQYDF